MTAEQDRATLPDALAARLAGHVVLVGVGNPLFGDDAAGCLVANGLAGAPGLEVVQADDVPERYVTQIADGAPDVVVLVDAVDLGALPGSVAVLEKEAMASYEPSTHRVPLGLIAEFIQRASGADVFVLAIQPGRVQLGADLSCEVARSVESLRELIRQLVTASGASAPRDASSAREAAPC